VIRSRGFDWSSRAVQDRRHEIDDRGETVRRALSYSNVMATLAVFVALGGSSYAAIKITGKDVRDNSLSSADVRNNSLRSADVRTNSLTSADVKNGSLQAKDFAVGEIPAGSMWSYRGDVPGGPSPGQTMSMPDIPGLGETSATCTPDGAAELSVKNSSAGVGFQYVATLTTVGGSKSSAGGIFPGAVATIALPPSAQVVWQISPVPAGTPGPVVTAVASNQVSLVGPAPVCSVSATAFYQDPVG
jgi:hypothetical protein